jgi:hypothetical protein
MTTVLIVIWAGLAFCLAPILGASLLAGVWVSLDDQHKHH